MVRSLPILFAMPFLVASIGCGADAPTTGDPDHIVGEECQAVLRVLQKDAYKSEAGRTSELWPPHTTTQLDVLCDGELVAAAVQANHGTKPDAVDGEGVSILVETAAFEVRAPRARLLSLLEAYGSCECDEATTFLSLDSLEDAVAQELLESVAGYLEANVTCGGDGAGELVALLAAGDVEGAISLLPACTWAGDASLAEGLDEALAALLEQTSQLLEGHHVCNNDAALQKGLFDEFERTGVVTPCDAFTDVCRGPLWLYAPASQKAPSAQPQ